MQGLAQRPYIGFGHIAHRRVYPAEHAFRYHTYFVLLPLRSMSSGGAEGLARNRFGLLSFHDRDHGLGGSDAEAWMDDVLKAQGIHDANGELWLQTYPRVMGHVFKPVSFWFAYRKNGTLAAVVAEVNNTFGERHCYVLPNAVLDGQGGAEAQKVLYVSPFNKPCGDYKFNFLFKATPDSHSRLTIRVDLHEAGQLLLQTSLGGALEPLSSFSAQRAFWGFPLMSLSVVMRIHWQALRLYIKGLPFIRKPAPPQKFVS